MFPIRDDNPHILTPYATYGIVALNALVWLFLEGAGTEPLLSGSVCRLGLVPGELLQTIPAGTGFEMGPATVCVVGDTSTWHTVVTSMFMHGSWFHIIGNMWFLWIFGNNVEDVMGRWRFVVFYLLCGSAAAGLRVATNPASAVPMVGASGAIGGVMGAYVLLFPRVHVHMLIFFGFCDASVAVAAESTRESHDITSERPLVTRHFPRPALGRAWLPEHPARSPLRRPELLTYTHHTTSSVLGAQKFPWAASSTISLSSVKSATARFKRPFSRSSSFRRRAWLTFIPPYSRLHR